MLESSERVLQNSQNNVLKDMGGKRDIAPDYSDGIPIAKHVDRPGLLRVDVSSTTVFGLFGPSGSGKTTGGVTIGTRCYDNGRSLFNTADTDLQFTNFDNNGGVSKELVEKMGLYGNEKPHEIEQKTIFPKFLYDEMSEEDQPTNVEVFTLGFDQINKSELKFLLSQGLSDKQKQKVELMLEKINLDSDTSFEDIHSAVDGLEEDFHPNALTTIRGNVDVLENSSMISNRSRTDFIDYLKKGYALSLGMKHFDHYLHEDDYYKAEFYASKCLRLVIEAIQNNELDPGFLCLLHEAHHLAPANEESILVDLLKRIFTFYKRRVDMPFILDSQSPVQIPGRGDSKNLLGELNHVFIGRDKEGKTLDPEDLHKVLRSMNVITNPHKQNKMWDQRMKDIGEREFLYVRPGMSHPREAPVVEFLAPLVSNP